MYHPLPMRWKGVVHTPERIEHNATCNSLHQRTECAITKTAHTWLTTLNESPLGAFVVIAVSSTHPDTFFLTSCRKERTGRGSHCILGTPKQQAQTTLALLCTIGFMMQHHTAGAASSSNRSLLSLTNQDLATTCGVLLSTSHILQVFSKRLAQR